jgi:hypothetical protein
MGSPTKSANKAGKSKKSALGAPVVVLDMIDSKPATRMNKFDYYKSQAAFGFHKQSKALQEEMRLKLVSDTNMTKAECAHLSYQLVNVAFPKDHSSNSDDRKMARELYEMFLKEYDKDSQSDATLDEDIPDATSKGMSRKGFKALISRSKGKQTDFVENINWVQSHFSNTDVTPEECPHVSAWEMLGWARDNRNDFFKMIVPKTKGEGDDEDKESQQQLRAEDKSIDDRRKILDRIMKEKGKEEKDEPAQSERGREPVGGGDRDGKGSGENTPLFREGPGSRGSPTQESDQLHQGSGEDGSDSCGASPGDGPVSDPANGEIDLGGIEIEN